MSYSLWGKLALIGKFPTKEHEEIVKDYSATTINETATKEALLIEIEAAIH